MADNSGIRVGAAGHFASRMTSALIASGQINAAQVMDTFADFTAQALDVLNSFETDPGQATVAPARATLPQVTVPASLAAMTDNGASLMGAGGVATAIMPEIKNASQLASDGINNGPLPEWLGPICAKYGVVSVFDNRHQLADGPTRPHFRQAGVPKGQQAKGFWPDSK